MPRIARIVIPGYPHHVTQRGNHRQTVFFSDSDRQCYLQLLSKYFSQFQVSMEGYVLMSTHIHQLLVPTFKDSLAKGVGRLHNDFARWQHIQQDLTGHLWQNRFHSTPTDEDHYWMALRYIELNPVRAGMVRHAWDWPWSSARAHVTGFDPTGLLAMDPWRARFDGERWKEFLEQGMNAREEIERIRLATRTGRPLGSEEFVRHLEAITGRSLRRNKSGPRI